MPTPATIKKLGNLTALSSNPIPQVNIPKLPEKLRRIDPDGCDQFQQELTKQFQDWVQKVNVLYASTNNQLAALVKK